MQHNFIHGDDKALTLQIINDYLSVETHLELLEWLQGDIQAFLPHEILISAWGDFSLGLIYLDIVALHPSLRTTNILNDTLKPKVLNIFSEWQSNHHKPLRLNIGDGCLDVNQWVKPEVINDLSKKGSIHTIQSAIVHGIKDQRGSGDCLYILLSKSEMEKIEKNQFSIFMPFIDCALRRIELLEDMQIKKNDDIVDEHAELNEQLSRRECGIMALVKEGKTNEEIGILLDISIFTVKNHLQKIFKKLEVGNRSQAAFKYKPQAKK